MDQTAFALLRSRFVWVALIVRNLPGCPQWWLLLHPVFQETLWIFDVSTWHVLPSIALAWSAGNAFQAANPAAGDFEQLYEHLDNTCINLSGISPAFLLCERVNNVMNRTACYGEACECSWSYVKGQPRHVLFMKTTGKSGYIVSSRSNCAHVSARKVVMAPQFFYGLLTSIYIHSMTFSKYL